MERWRNPALAAARWIAGAIFLVAAILFFGLETPPGHDVIAWAVGRLSGGSVIAQGLDGALPRHLVVRQVELNDKGGTWLRLRNVTIDWSPWALLDNRVLIERAGAQEIALLRRPAAEQPENGKAIEIDVRSITLPRLVIAKAVAAQDVTLSAHGELHFVSADDLSANLTLTRIGSQDFYRVNGAIANDVVTGSIAIREGPDGVLANLLELPGLRPINLTADASGGRSANKISLNLAAGPLRANGVGTLSLRTRRLDFATSASAPATALRPDLRLGALWLDGHVRGSLDAPLITARLRLDSVAADPLSAGPILANVSGHGGFLDIDGSVAAVRTKGFDTLAQAPFALTAHLNLEDKTHPVQFALTHPLVSFAGTADFEAERTVMRADVALPTLEAFSSVLHETLPGSARAHVTVAFSDAATAIAADGGLTLRGDSLPARLLGHDSNFSLQSSLHALDVTSLRFSTKGQCATMTLAGSLQHDTLKSAFSLSLPDLSHVTGTVQGPVTLSGSISGALAGPVIHAAGNAHLASAGFPRQPLTFSLDAKGLTDGHFAAKGRFDNASVSLHAALDPHRHATLAAKWKSLGAEANVTLPADFRISGRAKLAVGNLRDFASLLGMPVSGRLAASADFDSAHGPTNARVNATVANLRLKDEAASKIVVDGKIDRIFVAPAFDVTANASGLSSSGIQGDARAQIHGGLSALRISLITDHASAAGQEFQTSVAATADLGKKKVLISAWRGNWQGQSLTLNSPATFDFAKGLSVDRMQIDAGGGRLNLAGRILPSLSATVSADNIRASTFSNFAPQLSFDGTISGNAQLSGTIDAPRGPIAIEGRDLTPPGLSRGARASLDMHGTLKGVSADLDVALESGSATRLHVAGSVPLRAGRPLALAMTGNADLGLLNIILAARGQHVQGALAMKADIGGSLAAPLVSGNATIQDGEFEDVARGVRLRDVTVTAVAQGSAIHITRLAAQAGHGSMSASGVISLAKSGGQIALSAQMQNFRLITSDLVTAELSGNISLTGPLAGSPVLKGRVEVPTGELDLPEGFPPDVVTLNVRHRGQPAPPPSSGAVVELDMTIDAPNHIFVRGRGIDADVFGHLHVTGTSVAPFVTGEFVMNRGTFALAGQTLAFDSGKVSFNEAELNGRLDPWLDFVAESESGGIAATLTVSGYASQPKITLTSTPSLPQDEILAHLLFQQSANQLSGLQLAEMAQALSQLGGVGSAFNPLGMLRKRLGLDRLTVGSTSATTTSQAQTTVEAGRYVARNVYVGVKQTLSGATQAKVQYDITRRLKAQATVSTSTGTAITPNATVLQDNGSSVGLSFQLEY